MFPDTVDFLENFAEKKLFVSIKKNKKKQFGTFPRIVDNYSALQLGLNSTNCRPRFIVV